MVLKARRKSNERWAARKGGPRYVLARQIVAFLMVISAMGLARASPPGTVISNQALLDYESSPGVTVTVPSNIVQEIVAVVRSPASVEFTRVIGAGGGDYQETVGPSACFQGGGFSVLANPVLTGGGTIDPAQTQDVSVASSYNLGEPLFLRLTDMDQNLDFQVLDTAVVTVIHGASGDSETIQLTETGFNTGIFAGYVPSARAASSSGDCVLQGTMNSTVRVTYTDPADAADLAQSVANLDPVNVVFESRSGSIIDAVQIELVNSATGAPALVYGNDGISIFPSTITTGTIVIDSSGTSYAFGPGEFRFPVVPDGDYRLIVTPPGDYAAPSSAEIDDLQMLPGALYTLGPASFGAVFTQTGGLSFNWDIPVDPQSSALFLQKQSSTAVAAPGDFVRYELQLENSSVVGTVTDIQIIDDLPPNIRFVTGSAELDGVDVADPIISPDLRTLEFLIMSLAVGERATITYVAEIVGGQSNQELTNRATAYSSGGLLSNEATSTIILREDLFRSTATIVGRVLEADCSQEFYAEDQGVANIRIYLEDGRYGVTDAGGRFHFEGLTPGTHVAQLDTTTVPEWFDIIGCEDTTGFSGSADSQFVKLSQGSLLRADFYLKRKPRPEGRIDLELRSYGTDSSEQVAYELVLNGKGNVALNNINLVFLLPDGVHYLPGTMRVDGADLGDPRIVDSSVSIVVDDQFGNWVSKVDFIAEIDSQVVGELTTRALARFDSPIAASQKTPIAETKMIREAATTKEEGYVLDLKFDILSADLSLDDKLQLDLLISDWRGVREVLIGATGHSDSTRIAPRNRHLFADNYVLSQARALSAALYIADALDVPFDKLLISGRGPDEPVERNDTAAGRQANRRVEMVLSGIRPARPSFLEVTQESSGKMVTETKGAIPGEEAERNASIDDVDIDAGYPSSQIEPHIDTLRPQVDLLLPKSTFQPALPSTKISVQHEPQQSVQVFVNGAPVNSLNFDSVAMNTARTVAVSRWKGVDLEDGENDIRVIVTNEDGSRAKAFTRNLYYSGAPIRGEFVPEKSVLTADGKTRPVIAIRMFDRAGKPSRAGTVGTFRIDAPYRSWWEVENDRKNKLVAIGPREPSYRVGVDGIALLELEPTTQTGEVTLNLKFGHQREQEMRAWLSAANREWILVGFAEGTAAHNTLSQNLSAAMAAGHEEGFVDEGRVAFFAKGSIKGKYLLTIAYDSDRKRSDSRNSFETVVDPNANYPLYADTSEQRFEASSQRKLYVKLERNQFMALFGDYDTGLSVTDLARYERRFNGFKSEYRGDKFGYTVFAAKSSQAFHRDEFRGNGTSGLFQLGFAPIIANSEQVRIEVRDRYDSGLVISETRLSRFLDYNLDTVYGTLYFKRPIPSRDLDFNPVYIIVEYESASSADEDLVAGGRMSLKASADSIEFGVTHVTDDTGGAEADMSGIDVRWQINEKTLFKAEFAESNSIVAGTDLSGAAHSLEFEFNGEKSDVRAFLREVDDDFGLGYQSAADQGFRRLGIEARGRISDQWSLEGEASWQQNLETGDIRNLALSRVRFEHSSFSTTIGLTHADDQFADGETRTSDIGEVLVSQKVLDGRMTLRGSVSTSLSADAENTDYPTSLIFGADYKLRKGFDLVAEYEDSSGVGIDATMTRIGIKASPWSRTQINTFVTQEVSEFGPRVFSNVGLIQGFQLNEHWAIDFGVDQTATLTDSTFRQFDPDRELATGSVNDDFLAVYAGAMYSANAWSANTRLEHRNGDSEEQTTLLVGWYREPEVGHGLSAGMTVFRNESVLGDQRTSADFKLGWAYRKANSHWSFLNRTDLVYENAVQNSEQISSWRFINNFNANRRFGAVMQMSLQYAFKYVSTEFNDDGYSGYTDLIGVDWRRGFNRRWDFGANTSIYHSYQSGVIDYGFGVDVGFNLMDNMWVTLGYNAWGFHDIDFAQARYTAQGPYLRFTVKADQHFLKQITGR